MIAVLFADEGLLPAEARTPWTSEGAGSVTISGGRFRAHDEAVVSLQLEPTDTDARPVKRAGQPMFMQAVVRGRSEEGAWGSGASAIMLAINDGYRALAVSIGSTLNLVNPDTGAILAEVATNHRWTERATYRLAKRRSERWELHVDGKLAATLPYDFAPLLAQAARFWWGCWDNDNDAEFDAIEVSDRPIADAWKVDQAFYSLPAPVRSRFTATWRALLRSAASAFEGATTALQEVYGSLQAGRVVASRAAFKEGATWPNGWEVTGDWSIVRGRLQGPTDGSVGAAAWVFDLSVAPSHVEHRAAATWTVWESAHDSYGRLGPMMKVATDARAVVAQLFEVDGAARWGFTTDVTTGAAVEPLGEMWPVNAAAAHRVELVMQIGIAFLIVDGAVVDRLMLDAFDVSTVGYAAAEIAVVQGPVATVTVEDVLAEQASADERRRQGRIDLAVESLIFLGGLERNEEIEVWAHHKAGTLEMRATSAGIVAELRHLCGRGDGAWLFEIREPLEWVLDESYPEHTPVYLDQPGFEGVRVYVHWEHAAPNFTAAALGALVLRHLLPVSTAEVSYYAAVATRLTGAAVATTSLLTTLPVWSSEHFAEGDECILRAADGSAWEECSIASIPSTTQVRVLGVRAPINFLAGSALMRVLGRS